MFAPLSIGWVCTNMPRRNGGGEPRSFSRRIISHQDAIFSNQKTPGVAARRFSCHWSVLIRRRAEGLLAPDAGHHQAKFLHVCLTPLDDTHDAPLVHDRDAVTEVLDLIEVLRDEQGCRALTALGDKLAVDV